MNLPSAASAEYPLADGVVALPNSLAWLEASRAIVAADAHLAYEDVIGGALPLWSTPRSLELLLQAARAKNAREIIMLGDVIHGSSMSEGAATIVTTALARLRDEFTVTLVAGNHEGRTRGAAVLGDTEDAIERDGWLLVHGDAGGFNRRAIVGHLHPSLPLANGASVPVFLTSSSLVVVPALTPYSSGLNVLSRACTDALHVFLPTIAGVGVVASADDRVFPFGSLGALRAALKTTRAADSLENRSRRRYSR